jgi:peptide/nickel transport system substrate-binding protein
VFRIIPDYTAALTALKAGDVDLMPRLQPIQYAQQTAGPAFDGQFRKARYSIPQYYFIGWNEERPFFRDKRVRQALTMLVDRDAIIQTLRFGLAQREASPVSQGSPLNNPNLQPYPYDPKRAAQLLDEAGWTDHDGDGIRDKDGVPFKFEFLGQANSPFTTNLMPILKESLRKAGIEMTERVIEFTVLVNSQHDHKYDATASAWVAPLDADQYQIFHSSSIANRGSNWVSFRNAEADHLLEQARLEFDPEKRKQMMWRWQEIIHEEQPYTFLFYAQEAAAYQKRFQNVEWLPNRPGYDLNQWFVPKGMQKYVGHSE